ncbi:50S ribosomal protein L11 methyltransferase [Pelagicoccus sp. SDUM812005]|uniref:50S ribosomal protein L11 methyltransferase n=1 Tax=Pelagicoccus sp. SDUM812005 TaxID=3041257 RepID=UPI00280F5EE9|nr:50S ribosomal protein L11 methyltransferase [Pelagicoccus sp. SDUM812005]MDQ8180380.1 50S ribosomal protein L11 methyltransferase [Pelagicoccus sp. SDUM812005]
MKTLTTHKDSSQEEGTTGFSEMRFRELPLSSLEGRNYSHQRLLADRARCEAYRKAILDTVKAGDVVVDLGTGSGLLAFFAVEAGAKKVYAIELGPVIRYAERIAKRNSMDDRIEFIRGVSYDIELPELADVIVGENLGSLGIEENMLPMYQDAAKRFLKPGGKMIPSRLEVSATLVSDTGFHRRYIDPWKSSLYGIYFDTFLHEQLKTLFLAHFDSSRVVSAPQLFLSAKLDAKQTYSEINRKTLRFEIDRDTTLSGFIVYFTAELSEGVSISNGLVGGKNSWDQVYFSIDRVLSLEVGYNVTIHLCTWETRYEFVPSWRITVSDSQGKEIYDYSATRYPLLSLPPDLIGPIVPPAVDSGNRWVAYVLSLLNGNRGKRQLATILSKLDPSLSTDEIEHTLSRAFFFLNTHASIPSMAKPVLPLRDRADFLIQAHFDGTLNCKRIAEIVHFEFPDFLTPEQALERIQYVVTTNVKPTVGV